MPPFQVYKIVPGLEKDEYERERKFYADRGLPCPKDQMAEESEEQKKAEEEEAQRTPDANTNMDFHRFDEQVWIAFSSFFSCLLLSSQLLLRHAPGFKECPLMTSCDFAGQPIAGMQGGGCGGGGGGGGSHCVLVLVGNQDRDQAGGIR